MVWKNQKAAAAPSWSFLLECVCVCAPQKLQVNENGECLDKIKEKEKLILKED